MERRGRVRRPRVAPRTDDLHSLDIGDIVTTDDGLLVHLRRSKTDQTGTGRTVAITATTSGDPLNAVAAWVHWRNQLAAHVFHTGPAWRAIDRYGARPRTTRLTTKSLDVIIGRRTAAAGLVGDFGGHSLRRGFATSALAGGATERAVQRHGRWRSPASMSPYIDEAERFNDTPPASSGSTRRFSHLKATATDSKTAISDASLPPPGEDRHPHA